jgi:predicted deacylase
MKKRMAAALGALFLSITWLVSSAGAQVQHEVFLPHTDHELNVYRIIGEEPGRTIMIIGGIQGDEPGGYLTADLYADVHLKKGNLIVVPRANFYSILLNRRTGLTGDMNRKFDVREAEEKNYEAEIVAILKQLIRESDLLLNLHEGSGFYAPTWINAMENPGRFGQSIIFDAADYTVSGTGRMIHLRAMAESVVNRVNEQITKERYLFRVNDHDTLSEKSLHQEQRKSATYYALTQGNIPAFGVETSKSISSLAEKIQMHKLVINAFMEELGIQFDAPGIRLESPRLDYLIVRINGEVPVALPHKSELQLQEGDDIIITDVVSNYQRGLAVDIQDFGTSNDFNLPFRFSRATRILVRKDSEICGWVDLKPQAAPEKTGREPLDGEIRVEQFVVKVGGDLLTVSAGQTLTTAKGVRIILTGVRTNIARYDRDVLVNFKGFAPPKMMNDGNDLHFPIYTDQDLLARFSEDREGKRYPVEAMYQDKNIGTFWVELVDDPESTTLQN